MMDSNLLNMDELELIGEGKTKKIYAMKKDNDKVTKEKALGFGNFEVCHS